MQWFIRRGALLCFLVLAYGCGGGGSDGAATSVLPVSPQPNISAFTPASGPVDTVVTLTGSGFTGSTAAWVGAAHNAGLTVVSDTEADVTVPAGALTGLIAIVNPVGTASTASAFTVTAGPVVAGIRVQGNELIDASGQVVQLRGMNYSGFEFVAIQGWSPDDPSGAQAGQSGGPNWAAISGWHANVIRLPLNEASWLGYSCTDTDGVVHNPDPGGNYRSAIATQVAQANAAGIYVVLVLHWAAPGTACPMLQTQMADADHSLDFWTSVANTYKSNPAVMFCLFNEPFFNFEFSGEDDWSYLMFGTGGSFTGYPATSNRGTWQTVKKPWKVASYQEMIDTVRATGATNVVLIGGMDYASNFSGWLAHKPHDPLDQMAVSWHAYPTYGAPFGTYAASQPNHAPEVFTEILAIRAAGTPVVVSESGGQNSPGTVGAALSATITAFADANDISYLAWAWDVWDLPDNVLIKDVNGTPTDGYGVFVRNWMINHAP